MKSRVENNILEKAKNETSKGISRSEFDDLGLNFSPIVDFGDNKPISDRPTKIQTYSENKKIESKFEKRGKNLKLNLAEIEDNNFSNGGQDRRLYSISSQNANQPYDGKSPLHRKNYMSLVVIFLLKFF